MSYARSLPAELSVTMGIKLECIISLRFKYTFYSLSETPFTGLIKESLMHRFQLFLQFLPVIHPDKPVYLFLKPDFRSQLRVSDHSGFEQQLL
ncbi:hypothetical protein NT017_22740 [Prolixibacter sp. NT017]|nr:hypothetical protein NT017_22740 [Prolixibacter sp. NT017]